MERRTWSPKQADLETGKRWYLVDAEGKTLGRLASVIAATLRGKTKPTYSPHADMGDYVVVINAEKVALTGNKETDKYYYRHSGYPGGLRRRSVREVRMKHPERLIESAVRGMLPGNVLGEKQFRKLKVYVGPNHPHRTQQPEALPLEA
ncbi:MAG: 50S ribosomal protein L13 [Thermomicrobiales bacterium]|nr:50S ribosomal protein L13 [Thermomicrobiales bacterium]